MAKRFKRDEKDLQEFWENSYPQNFTSNCNFDVSAGDVSPGASINPNIGERYRPGFFNRKVR